MSIPGQWTWRSGWLVVGVGLAVCQTGQCQGTPPLAEEPIASMYANLGDMVMLQVKAVGTPPLAYRWKLEGVTIAGATSSTLVITDVQNVNFGSYSIRITNAFGATLASRELRFLGGGGGLVNLNTRLYQNSQVTHVYEPEPDNPSLSKTGNSTNDIPPGWQTYGGGFLIGSNYVAQVWAAKEWDQPQEKLVGASPLAYFRTNTTGILKGIVWGTGSYLQNVPPGYPSATVQVRAWDSRGGTVTNWFQVLADPTVPRGLSPLLNITNVGGTMQDLPNDLVGLQSFNLFVPANQRPTLSVSGTSGAWSAWSFGFAVNGDVGAVYEIETTTNLTGNWSYLATVTNCYGQLRFTDPSATAAEGCRFYRVRRLP